MTTLSQIRTKLIEAIQQSGITQTELAKRVGVIQQTIAAYLHQNKMPALDTFANLCEVLDLDANDILCIHEYAEKKAVTVNNSFNNNSGKIDFKA